MTFRSDISWANAEDPVRASKLNKWQNASSNYFAFFAYENDPADLQLKIVGGNSVLVGGQLFSFSDLLSPAFTPPGVGTETHLLYAYNNNGVLDFDILTTGFTAGDPSTYQVDYPIAEVELTAGQTQIVNVNITDVRSGSLGVSLSVNDIRSFEYTETINQGECLEIFDSGGTAKVRKVTGARASFDFRFGEHNDFNQGGIIDFPDIMYIDEYDIYVGLAYAQNALSGGYIKSYKQEDDGRLTELSSSAVGGLTATALGPKKMVYDPVNHKVVFLGLTTGSVPVVGSIQVASDGTFSNSGSTNLTGDVPLGITYVQAVNRVVTMNRSTSTTARVNLWDCSGLNPSNLANNTWSPGGTIGSPSSLDGLDNDGTQCLLYFSATLGRFATVTVTASTITIETGTGITITAVSGRLFYGSAHSGYLFIRENTNQTRFITVTGTTPSASAEVATPTFTPAYYTSRAAICYHPTIERWVALCKIDTTGGNVPRKCAMYTITISGGLPVNDTDYRQYGVEQPDSEYLAIAGGGSSVGLFGDWTIMGTSVVSWSNVVVGTLFENKNNSYIGIAQENGTVGQTKKVKILGGIDRNQSGMTPGEVQYIQSDGTVGELDMGLGTAGRALNPTDMIITKNP